MYVLLVYIVEVCIWVAATQLMYLLGIFVWKEDPCWQARLESPQHFGSNNSNLHENGWTSILNFSVLIVFLPLLWDSVPLDWARPLDARLFEGYAGKY